jgi:hypothetical protein
MSSREFHDWYRVEVANLPIDIARIICQRANCWWDMDLRHRYNHAVFWTGAFLVTSITVLALLLDCTAQTFFGLVVAPLLPFLAIAPKLVQDNSDAIMRLQAMKDAIDGMWKKILLNDATPEELMSFSNTIQGGIFNNRKNNPLVFDWVHRRAKPQHEDTTSKSTAHYVAEFKQSQTERRQ